MTSKEWVKEQLSYTDDHWTTSDRIMLTKILKDLERLEALEKENKEIEELYLNENKHWCETIDSLRKENEKLKKAIEILKRRVISLKGIKDCESATEYNRYTSLGLITQQEYELLKEVLGE